MRWSIPLRLGLCLLLLLGGYLGYKSWGEHQRNAKIQMEIDALEREAEKIRRENGTLAQKIEYFASPDFQEQEAKKKLGLRRQEESVITLHEIPVLPDGNGTVETHPTAAKATILEHVPNYQKWWQRFFE